MAFLHSSLYDAAHCSPAVESSFFGQGFEWCLFILSLWISLPHLSPDALFLNIGNVHVSQTVAHLWLWRSISHTCFVWLFVQKHNFLSDTKYGESHTAFGSLGKILLQWVFHLGLL